MALVDTTTGEIVSDLTRAEARDLTDTIKSNVDSLWSLLKESHDRKAWAALGYGSWREYATTEFGISQSRAYQMLDQAKVIAELEAASSTVVEITESTARVLKPALAEAKAAVEEASRAATSDEDKQERVRKALDNLRSDLVEQKRPSSEPAPAATRLAPQPDPAPGTSGDEDVQAANLRRRFYDSLVRSGDAWSFDGDVVAPLLTADDWKLVAASASTSKAWFDRLLEQRPGKGLRVMKGGKP